MTVPTLTEAEREVELQHIVYAAGRISDGDESDLANEQDSGPRMLRTVFWICIAFYAPLVVAAYSFFSR